MKKDEQKKLSENWLIAATTLSVRVDAPYILKGVNEVEIQCIAFLPDFGGPKGMVLGSTSGPSYEVDALLKAAAEYRGLYYSFISSEAYENFDECLFKEALTDWGYFGADALRPEWLKMK